MRYLAWLFVLLLLLAAGMAFNSGTDSSLLYESLESLGRGEEIALHEAKAQTASFRAAAAASIIGGLARLDRFEVGARLGVV